MASNRGLCIVKRCLSSRLFTLQDKKASRVICFFTLFVTKNSNIIIMCQPPCDIECISFMYRLSFYHISYLSFLFCMLTQNLRPFLSVLILPLSLLIHISTSIHKIPLPFQFPFHRISQLEDIVFTLLWRVSR